MVEGELRFPNRVDWKPGCTDRCTALTRVITVQYFWWRQQIEFPDQSAVTLTWQTGRQAGRQAGRQGGRQAGRQARSAGLLG